MFYRNGSKRYDAAVLGVTEYNLDIPADHGSIGVAYLVRQGPFGGGDTIGRVDLRIKADGLVHVVFQDVSGAYHDHVLGFALSSPLSTNYHNSPQPPAVRS